MLTRSPASRAIARRLDKIRRPDYALYEERGQKDGHDIDDWLRTETGLRATASKAAAQLLGRAGACGAFAVQNAHLTIWSLTLNHVRARSRIALWCGRAIFMPHYEFFCHTCNRPFSKTLTPTEYKEGKLVCPRRSSEEVEPRWFYPVTAQQSV